MRIRIASSLVILILVCGTAIAGSPRLVSFDLPAQPLNQALNALARQAQLRIVFATSAAEGITAPAIKGKVTVEQALDLLLAGTQIKYQYMDERTISLMQSGTAAPGKTTATAGDRGLMRLAQSEGTAVQARNPADKDQPGADASMEAQEAADASKDTPEILVKGSRVLNLDIKRSRDAAQPYVVFDHAAIVRSGAVNLEAFLKNRLTMNTARNSQSQFVNGSNVSSVNLRGLGSSQTLILIDGRRAPGLIDTGSPLQADLNGIPLSAVERIEVLPATASGMHGGAATGGVLNVVLRRDFSGVEVMTTYDNTFKSDAAVRRLDFSAGFSLEGGRTTVLMNGSYSDANALSLQDRDLLQRGRARLLANNDGSYAAAFPGASPPLGATGNIFSANGTNLVLDNGMALNSPRTFVPVGYAGAASDGGVAFLANAGRYNLALADNTDNAGGGRIALGNTPIVKSLAATVRRQFMPRLDAYLDLFASDNRGLFDIGGASFVATVPAGASTNPFQQNINVLVPVIGRGTPIINEWSTRRAIGGIIMGLPRGWKGVMEYNWAENRFDNFQQGPRLGDLSGPISTGQIDVLRDVNAFPVDWTQLATGTGPFLSYPVAGPVTGKGATLRLSGPLGRLAGGAPVLTALIETRDEEFAESIFRQILVFGTLYATLPSRSQSFDSVYLEGVIPLVSASNRRTGIEALELQVSARRDEYSVNGVTGFLVAFGAPSTAAVERVTSKNSANSYTLAMKYSPLEDVALRASYGTGFLPPTVNQVLASTPTTNTLSGVFDPMRGNTAVTGLVENRAGGNPGIRPESSESWSAGLVLTPRFIPALRVSVDYVRTGKTDNIAQLGFQQILDNEARFPGRVSRGARLDTDPVGWAGPVTRLDRSLINTARTEVAAYDLQADYSLRTATFGTWDFFALATRQTQFRNQLLPELPLQETIGIAGAPLKFKANGGMSWTYGAAAVGWNVRYFDSYWVTDPASPAGAALIRNQGNGGIIASQTYHDLFLRYDFGDAGPQAAVFRRPFNGCSLAFGVQNIFNDAPPFDASSGGSPGLYSTYGDPRLASYYLSLKKNW